MIKITINNDHRFKFIANIITIINITKNMAELGKLSPIFILYKINTTIHAKNDHNLYTVFALFTINDWF